MSVSLSETTPVGPGLDGAVEVFLSLRPRLFGVALRVTGDRWTAEDVVQEAWLRWQRTDRAVIRNPAAFLTTVTSRLAINLVQSAGRRHETSAGARLDDLVDPGQDALAHAERAIDVEQTIATLVARVGPAELAGYVLRKGFDYTYRDIAALLRTSVANARQLVRRAQLRVEHRTDRAVLPHEHHRVAAAFLRAAASGELAELEEVLTGRRLRDGAPCVGVRSGRGVGRPAPRPVAAR